MSKATYLLRKIYTLFTLYKEGKGECNCPSVGGFLSFLMSHCEEQLISTSRESNLLKKSWLFLFLSLISSTAFSQASRPIDSTTIIIESGYEPFLTDAFKIKDNPIINDTNKIIPQLKYSFLQKQVPVTFNIYPISPAVIKGEPLVKLYHGFAKVGFGTNATPLAEIYYNATRSKNYAYGFAGKHFSSTGISSIDYSGFSDNELSAFGKQYSKEFTLYGKLGYIRNVNHYYGFSDKNAALINDADAVRQELDKFNVNFKLTRNFTDTTQYDYDFDISYHNINDLFQVSENHFAVAGKLSKYYKNELFAIGTEINYNKLINRLNQENNLVVGLNPHISTIADKWEFQVGIGLYLNSYPDTKFHFYPKAEFKFNIVEHIIIPYVGIKGGLISNNLNDFYNENPFINTQLLVTQNSNQKYDIYGGIRGSLSSKITFNTSFSQQKIEGMPLYVKDFSNLIENQFVVEYDTVSFSKINAELTYQKLEKLRFILGGSYYNYTPKNELKAWHKPAMNISLSSIYDLGDKIVVRLDLFYIDKQYVKTFSTVTTNNTVVTTEEATELKGIFDANLSLEYRYTKKLSGFINFNNIASSPYQKFQDYPTQKLGVLGGLTYSF
ncbi:MAG: hypothetical protein COX70_03380 [Flavobacteriales bacterium CG_4_10_14_0_2_um_filter_32_8]|nr:MAG: hypothetical protein COX70_03380 [Flavobacteriales bacterium CG_4_10_14_0_2_um_filter_32_8]